MVEASAAGSTDRALILLRQADLFHEVLVVPEEPFMVHRVALPVADGGHADREALARGLNEFAVAGGHGLRKRAGHHARYRGPGAGAEADGVHLDRDIRGEDEKRLQVLDVLLDSFRLVAVRPGHHDVFRVTFVQPVPFLVTKDVEVQRVEDLEVLLDRWRLLLVRRRRRRGVLRRRLPEGDGGESGGCEAGQEIAMNRVHEGFLSREGRYAGNLLSLAAGSTRR